MLSRYSSKRLLTFVKRKLHMLVALFCVSAVKFILLCLSVMSLPDDCHLTAYSRYPGDRSRLDK